MRPGPSGASVTAGETTSHGRVQQFEDAFARGHGGLQDVVLFAEVHDRAEEAQSVLDEGDQHAQRATVGTRWNAISVFQLKLTATLVTGVLRITSPPPNQMTQAIAIAERMSTAG